MTEPVNPFVKSVLDRATYELTRADRGAAAPPQSGPAFAQLCWDTRALWDAGLWPELEAEIVRRNTPRLAVVPAAEHEQGHR